jgi:asparagine N-glycosylation enzyme membrane subunit Stt3
MLPIAYAVVLAPLLLLSAGYFESMGLRWYHMIPTALFVFSYIPITQLGINIARHMRSKNIMTLTWSLGLVLIFGITIWCIAFIPLKSIQPLLLLIVLYFLTYMTREPTDAVTNQPLQPSGGSTES